MRPPIAEKAERFEAEILNAKNSDRDTAIAIITRMTEDINPAVRIIKNDARPTLITVEGSISENIVNDIKRALEEALEEENVDFDPV